MLLVDGVQRHQIVDIDIQVVLILFVSLRWSRIMLVLEDCCGLCSFMSLAKPLLSPLLPLRQFPRHVPREAYLLLLNWRWNISIIPEAAIGGLNVRFGIMLRLRDLIVWGCPKRFSGRYLGRCMLRSYLMRLRRCRLADLSWLILAPRKLSGLNGILFKLRPSLVSEVVEIVSEEVVIFFVVVHAIHSPPPWKAR
jgi:hypothetical protein